MESLLQNIKLVAHRISLKFLHVKRGLGASGTFRKGIPEGQGAIEFMIAAIGLDLRAFDHRFDLQMEIFLELLYLGFKELDVLGFLLDSGDGLGKPKYF